MVLVVFPVFPVFWEILHNPNAHSQQSTSLPAILSDTIVTNHQGTVWSPPLIQRPAPALCWSLGPPTPRPPLVALRAAVATVSEGHRVSIGCESVAVQTPARRHDRRRPPARGGQTVAGGAVHGTGAATCREAIACVCVLEYAVLGYKQKGGAMGASVELGTSQPKPVQAEGGTRDPRTGSRPAP